MKPSSGIHVFGYAVCAAVAEVRLETSWSSMTKTVLTIKACKALVTLDAESLAAGSLKALAKRLAPSYAEVSSRASAPVGMRR
jgi:hypothetical protein